MPIFLALLISACSPWSMRGVALPWSVDFVSSDLERRPPPVLTLTGSEWLVPGEPADFEVTGAAPGERVYLVAAAGMGEGPCHEGLGGLCLDLETPVHRVVHAFAEEGGAAQFELTVPSRWAPGRPLVMQAVVVRGLAGVDTGKSGTWSVSVVESWSETGDTGDRSCWLDTGDPPDPLLAADDGLELVPSGEFAASYALLEYDHHHATIAMASSGEIMVGYDDGEPPIARVKATVFDAEDAPVSDDFFVAWLGEYAPGRPDVIPVGEHWWVGYSDATDVYLVEFDAAGEEVGRTAEPLNIASGTTLYQGMPDLAVFEGEERILVTYAFGDEDAELQGRYYARIVDTTMTPVSDEWMLSETPIGPSPPDAARVGDHVAITWSTRAEGCEGPGVGKVWVQRFDSEGGALGPPVRVDQGTLANPPTRPVVEGDDEGRLVVAWRAQTFERDGSGVRLRVLDSEDEPVTTEWVVGAVSPDTANRPVLSLEGSVVAIAWEEWTEETGKDVYVNVLDLDTGAWIGEPVQAHADLTGEQERPAIATRTLETGDVEVVVSYEQVDPITDRRAVWLNRIFLDREE